MLVNLAEASDEWLFALYSPENFPVATHLVKLVEKRIRKPFSPGPTPRMSEREYIAGATWILERFLWLETALKSPDELIQAALSYGGQGQAARDRVGPVERVTAPARRTQRNRLHFVDLDAGHAPSTLGNAHVWLVVHPAKIYKDRTTGTRPLPTPYDLSGSAHWYNKADNILTVHRDQAAGGQDVEVHIQKVRFKHCGRVGAVALRYDRVTGRYSDPDAVAEATAAYRSVRDD